MQKEGKRKVKVHYSRKENLTGVMFVDVYKRQMYSRDLSRKVRSAMKTHAKNGEYMPAFPKYGYIKDPEDMHHLVIDPEAAETVKLIFTMAADGKTKGQIAKYLNETHVLTCRA